jgi:hypothetical protein
MQSPLVSPSRRTRLVAAEDAHELIRGQLIGDGGRGAVSGEDDRVPVQDALSIPPRGASYDLGLDGEAGEQAPRWCDGSRIAAVNGRRGR